MALKEQQKQSQKIETLPFSSVHLDLEGEEEEKSSLSFRCCKIDLLAH
jgi:hypothetical protein